MKKIKIVNIGYEEEEEKEEIYVDPCALYYEDHLRYMDEEQHSDEYIHANDNDALIRFLMTRILFL
eukprot:CAMPEP_0170981722 /NCGR_PEP_ID=MMETSP0736-20130129/3181_1 /TAXON_ID=186038 /ORGANISM="Fragilariopsis kerguelensis, Strain L26-C5" /LENGTH=65 /DNA_ID=CAMNT_0011404771 /DNA_START=272 /DNA_END=470 /DNA_ORIENTATION=+